MVVKVGRSVCTMLDDGYGGEAVKGNVLDRLSMYGENAATTLDCSRSTPCRPTVLHTKPTAGSMAITESREVMTAIMKLLTVLLTVAGITLAIPARAKGPHGTSQCAFACTRLCRTGTVEGRVVDYSMPRLCRGAQFGWEHDMARSRAFSSHPPLVRRHASGNGGCLAQAGASVSV